MRRPLYLALLVGCSFDHGTVPGDNPGTDAGMRDGMMTDDAAMVIPPDAQQCWSVPGVGLDVCLVSPPSGDIVITGEQSINTDKEGMAPLECKPLAANSSEVCAIAGQSITVSSNALLSASGSRPLVLIGATSITIDGTIDVASHRGGQQGPASGLPGCNNGQNPSAQGGGQGGSFGGRGGDGGDHEDDENSGGRAGMAMMVTVLRGGCQGGAGSPGGSPGGHGGGAIALVTDSLVLGANGTINASGAGGPGASPGRRGGSGGGSGGMIVLAAGTITAASGAQIFANGGHGGGGSTNQIAGGDGNDPTSATSSGSGGDASGDAGDGGRGYPSPQRNGQTADDEGSGGGGGGGGGGAGLIKVFSTSPLAGAQVSPPPS